MVTTPKPAGLIRAADREGLPGPALAVALLLALGLFLSLEVAIEQRHEDGQLRIIGEQQHALSVLIRRAVDNQLGTLSGLLLQVADNQARIPDSASLSRLFAGLEAVHHEIAAHALLPGAGPALAGPSAAAAQPVLAEAVLRGWLERDGLPARGVLVSRPYVAPGALLLGLLARVPPPPAPPGGPAPAPGPIRAVGLTLDMDQVLGRYLRTIGRLRTGQLTLFDQSGIILYDEDAARIGTRAFPDAPGQDTDVQAMYRAMLGAPSGSLLCPLPPGPRRDDTCRIMSWDSLSLGGWTLYITIRAEEARVAAHLVSAGRRRMLVAGLFGLVLVAVAGLFVRARTQRRLAYHNQLLEAQNDASPDGILVMDPRCRPVLWNARLPAILGVGPEDLPPGDPDAVMRALDVALAGGEASFLGLFSRLCRMPAQPMAGREVRLGDGRTLEVHSRGFADAGGRARGRVWHLRDVTHQLRAQQAQRESRELLQSIIDNVPSMVYLRDDQGRYILTNRPYNRFFGWPPEHAVGLRPDELLPADEARRIMNADASLLATESPLEYEETIGGVHGPRTMLTREVPMRDEGGAVTGICGVSTDVTALKEMQARLRASLDEFESIFDNSLVGVLLQRPGRTIARANARLGEIFGYDPARMLGRTSEFMHRDRAHYEEFGRQYVASLVDQPVFNVEYAFRHSDGHELWCQLSGKALDRHDLDQGVIWVIEDISERKNLERLRDDVESIMRHDLKTPLTTVVHVPMLLEEDGNLTGEQRELLTELKNAGYRMLEMINRSLDLMKMERGTYALRPETFDLLPLLGTVLRDLGSMADSHGLLVELTGPDGPLEDGAQFPIHGERLLCYSLFANLLKNAMEASPRGGAVRLCLDAADGPTVAIGNQGAVPAELRERFFEKYASAGKASGTGLGTYSARLIAEAQGGSVSMRTSERDGTTITVRLPGPPDRDQRP